MGIEQPRERPIVASLQRELIDTPYEVLRKDWPQVGSLIAGSDNSPSGIESISNGNGTSAYFFPNGTTGVTLPGYRGDVRSGCSNEPVSAPSLTLIKLPDGRELAKLGHSGCDLEEISHRDALDSYRRQLPSSVELRMWHPSDYDHD